MATDIALILTVDAEGDDALREAEAVADGLGQEGENVSVLGPVESHDGAWTGGDTDALASNLQSLLTEYGVQSGPCDPAMLAGIIARNLTGIQS